MAYRGHVQNGKIVLNDKVHLPEGSLVEVMPVDLDVGEPLHPDLIRFVGILPADMDVDKIRCQALMEKYK
ncbi:MAG: hypothetical protein N3D11_09455 [Candidatus Sumerlaeia bacterium]|nr:hypothetical protein [Candidatus Sumerlaeia bacterium]